MKLAVLLLGLVLLSIPIAAYEENVEYEEDASVSVKRAEGSPAEEKSDSILPYLLGFGLLTSGIIFLYRKEDKK